MLFDYPGRGASTGPATPECTIMAGAAVADWATARPPGPLVYHGFSFGGFIAAHAAAQAQVERAPALVVLESTAVNVRSWISDVSGPLGGAVAVDLPPALDRFDNAQALATSRAEIWIVGAADDRSVPGTQARALYEALILADRNATLDIFPGGHGAALQSRDGQSAYAERVANL
ncbi:alpha/beta fold hydrolase [Brevundimonas sp.]|uniref:alpha/beta hydrolase family protein n=1 Tax=Brevundimonas sp. TaxID=1871086 RepID=UPI002D1F9EE1|nr:alpha/beta fold hydrolase [Brevundimonas sp.]